MTTDTKPATWAKSFEMLIDGQWVAAKSGQTFERLSPANGESARSRRRPPSTMRVDPKLRPGTF